VSDERRTDLKLARVLVEAGEAGTLIDWTEAELHQLYDDLGRWLDDPYATSAERDYATRTRARLAELFAELRELADAEEEEEEP
jgi:hypothetical protein